MWCIPWFPYAGVDRSQWRRLLHDGLAYLSVSWATLSFAIWSQSTGRAMAGPPPSRAAARARCRLLSAEADRVAVRVREYADPRLRRDLARGVALGCASREQGLAGGVEILDVGKRHRPPASTRWIEADLEAVNVVADVVRLVGVG